MATYNIQQDPYDILLAEQQDQNHILLAEVAKLKAENEALKATGPLNLSTKTKASASPLTTPTTTPIFSKIGALLPSNPYKKADTKKSPAAKLAAAEAAAASSSLNQMQPKTSKTKDELLNEMIELMKEAYSMDINDEEMMNHLFVQNVSHN